MKVSQDIEGQPAYEEYKRLTVNDLHKLSYDEILYSYIIIHADFSFSPDTKYPSIPVMWTIV